MRLPVHAQQAMDSMHSKHRCCYRSMRGGAHIFL
jgi:hypothetical protein